MKTKFRPNQELFFVNEAKIIPVKVISVILKETLTSSTVNYEVVDVKGRKKILNEAYLVKDFNKAKQSAKTNWGVIANKVMKNFQEMKPTTYSKAKEEIEKEKEDE